jgi:hypothetical protein
MSERSVDTRRPQSDTGCVCMCVWYFADDDLFNGGTCIVVGIWRIMNWITMTRNRAIMRCHWESPVTGEIVGIDRTALCREINWGEEKKLRVPA